MASSSQQARLGGSRQSRPHDIESGQLSEGIAPSDSTPASQSRHNDGQYIQYVADMQRTTHRFGAVKAVRREPELTSLQESWVEIASQPSSSSLSSIGDEIVTTGLQVGNQSSYSPRRRRPQRQSHQQSVQQRQQHMPPTYIVSHAAAQAGTSSQEEYDETESEEDHLLTSSTENIRPRPATATIGLPRSRTTLGLSSDFSDSEDDDDGTALGRPTSFRPQPNAFTHPPAHLSHRSHSTNSAIPPHHPGARPSAITNRSHNRARTNFTSPAYQADNDAALRASLTTLLSCAAAAKSLPGRRAATADTSSGEPVLGAGVGPGNQPMELRLVPESEIEAGGSPGIGSGAPKSPQGRQPTTRTTSNSSAQSVPASTSSERAKRAAAGQSKPQRANKKKRTAATAVDDNTVTWISPATLTWVLGTGVVLLVSVVGFGAGFVVGREVGRQDILSSMSGGGPAAGAGVNASSCGGEVVRSTGTGTLRRWRWGTGMTKLVSA
ncbi:hypothetical protein VPNG_09213 [Cytospora leucostoma]|uniref:Uncharacterized protein n=1 Tax=Cytospora leucostoma TaxID=1230097 RepID=A0A423VUH2_9PEZI|nr:hypothetical protein VPNG_09213 [Cytospora leucostoma]